MGRRETVNAGERVGGMKTDWKIGDRVECSGSLGHVWSRPKKGNKRLGDWVVWFDGELYLRHVQEWYMKPVEDAQ